jgi:hypothetical protein
MNRRAEQKHSDAFEAWIEEARKVTVTAYLQKRGHWDKKMIGDAGVPCPGCGGTDRFAVNTRKNVFFCRASGAAGDAIAAAEHIFGLPFLDAVEDVAGLPPPEREARESAADRDSRVARLARQQAEAAEKQKIDAAEANHYRDRERREGFRLWQQALPISGTPVEEYLALRRLAAPGSAHLRYMPSARYWHKPPPDGACLHVGPAMAAAIVGPHGRFIGLHRTWIDLAQPKGKLVPVDPETGEILKAKKTRGSWKGGSILVARAEGPPEFFVAGEGIETVLGFRAMMLLDDPGFVARAEFRAAVSLDNLGGKAAGRVAHPTETKVDRRGRVRHVLIGSDEPEPFDDLPLIRVPGCVEEIVLLRDGDSEPARTSNAMTRAAKRFHAAYPHCGVKIVAAAEGEDFGDSWIRRAA